MVRLYVYEKYHNDCDNDFSESGNDLANLLLNKDCRLGFCHIVCSMFYVILLPTEIMCV